MEGKKMLEQDLRNIVTQVEDSFIVPEYHKVRIRYVGRKQKADVWISLKHSLSDYFVLGSFALSNALTERKPEITVYHEPFSKRSKVTLFTETGQKTILVEAKLLLQIVEPINTIYDELYNARDKFSMVGLGLATALMPQFAGADMLPGELMQKICLKDFGDIITAQKNVFELLKTYMGLTKAGIYQELEKDCL